MKKSLLLLIKYIPIIQMVGVLLNNTLFYYDILVEFVRLNNYMIGNSVITTILLYVCSYVFKFCNWYRLIVISNFINITIAAVDLIFHIPISNLELLVLYYTIYIIFLIIILVLRFKNKCISYNRNVK